MVKKYTGKVEEAYFTKLLAFMASNEGKREEGEQLGQRAAALEALALKKDAYTFKRKFLSVFPFKI